MKNAELLPRSLKQNLIIHDLDDETLIYDMTSAHAYCLNRSSALVWKYCDGKTTVSKAAQLLQLELGAPVNTDLVLLAIKQLRRHGLVERTGNPPQVSRRELVLKYAPAALALPLIASISAPAPAQAASCAMQGQPCGPPPCCPGLNCDGTCFAA
jgi:Coenzyme PQQ synthesis protein D (PqqD)